MFNGIKNWKRNRTIKRRLVNFTRDRKFHNIESAETLGILYEYKDKNTTNVITNLFQSFSAYDIKCVALGYYKEKTLPLEYAPLSKNTIFCDKDLNWFGQPIASEAEYFINQDFDILIDLSRSSEFTFKFIATLSRAAFKIGGIRYEKDPYDLVFIEQSNTEKGFIEEVFKFLLTVRPL